MSLTAEKKEEIKETFLLFTKQMPDKINKKDIGNLLRSLYQSPTELQIKEIQQNLDDFVSFDDFLKVYLRENGNEHKSFDEMKVALEQLDEHNSGLISILQMKNLMCSFGEPFSDKEFDDLIKFSHIEVVDGLLNYDVFLKKISF